MKFRASEMPMVVPCPGSKRMSTLYPDTSGVEANEGTVAHEVAGDALQNGTELKEYLNEILDGVLVDQDMIRHLTLYVEECRKGKPGKVEHGMSANYEGHTLTGTPDYWQFDPATGCLRIPDLKFGHGVVDVFENWQLLTYAFLAWEFVLRLNPGQHNAFKTIELVIVQPRANHPAGPTRKWSFDADHIRTYRNKILGAMAEAALENPPIRTGAHCRYCPGLLACQGSAIAASYAMEYAGTLTHGEMKPAALSHELELVDRAFKMLRDRQTALIEMGLALNKAGDVVPGWESRRDPGALAWDGDHMLTIGDLMDVDLRKSEAPITPTQAINQKLLTEKQVLALATRRMGGLTFKRVDHARAKRILG